MMKRATIWIEWINRPEGAPVNIVTAFRTYPARDVFEFTTAAEKEFAQPGVCELSFGPIGEPWA